MSHAVRIAGAVAAFAILNDGFLLPRHLEQR